MYVLRGRQKVQAHYLLTEETIAGVADEKSIVYFFILVGGIKRGERMLNGLA